MGPISVSVREVTPTTSPGNPGPGLLTTATVAAPTPPAEPTTTTTTPSPSSGHHSHFQGNDLPSISKKKKKKISSFHDARIESTLCNRSSIRQVFIFSGRRGLFSDRYSPLCCRNPPGSTILSTTRSNTCWSPSGTLSRSGWRSNGCRGPIRQGSRR